MNLQLLKVHNIFAERFQLKPGFKERLRRFINSLLWPFFEALAEDLRDGFRGIEIRERAIMDAIADIKAGWDNVKSAVGQAATDIEAAAAKIGASSGGDATLEAIANDMNITASNLKASSSKLEGALNPPAASGGPAPADGGAAPAPADGGAAPAAATS